MAGVRPRGSGSQTTGQRESDHGQRESDHGENAKLSTLLFAAYVPLLRPRGGFLYRQCVGFRLDFPAGEGSDFDQMRKRQAQHFAEVSEAFDSATA